MKTIKAEAEKLIDLIRGIEDLTLAEADFMKPGQLNCINLEKELHFEFICRWIPPASIHNLCTIRQ